MQRRLLVVEAVVVFGSLLAITANAADSNVVFGCDQNNGSSQQRVMLRVGNRHLAGWAIVPGEMRPVILPNGFRLGIKIEPASKETYVEQARRLDARYVPELVKITHRANSLIHGEVRTRYRRTGRMAAPIEWTP